MNTGGLIKHAISSNHLQRKDRVSTSGNRLSTISPFLAKKLKRTLAYKRLQKCYFLMRVYCLRCISPYIAWVAGGTSFNGEDYD